MDEILFQELKEQLMDSGLDEDSAEVVAIEQMEYIGVFE